MTRRSLLGLRGTGVALALVVGAAGGLAACNFIVSAGSYSVGGSDSGPAIDSSSVDTGTVDVMNDTSQLDVIADSGTATDTTPPTESGATCGTGLPTTTTAFQKLVTTCTLAASCSPYGFTVTISQCIEQDFLHATSSFACLSAISDCAGFMGCLGIGYVTPAQCPTTGTAPFCDANNVAINCGGGRYTTASQENCTLVGGTCQVFTSDAGAGADCKVLSSCSQADDGTAYCQGNTLFLCIGGVGYGQNCTNSQSKCIEDPVNGTSCYFNTPSCAYSGMDTYNCASGNVNWCTQEGDAGSLFSFNCSGAGLTCVPNADMFGTAECIAPGCTGTDYMNCTESCSGTKANVCVGGAQYTFDCASIASFTTCSPLTDSVGNPYVICK